MPDGGRITVETANRWLYDRAARDRDLSPGQYVSLYVSDNGTGMPEDVAERAFNPFFTTKPLGEGTGPGLSMIYGFSRRSGGQVRIYLEVDKGTMVCIYLPRHLVEEKAEVEDAPEVTVSAVANAATNTPREISKGCPARAAAAARMASAFSGMIAPKKSGFKAATISM